MKFLRIKTIATAALVFTTTAMGSGLLTVPRAIAAQTTTGTLTVTASVGASCAAPDNATLDFGAFDPLRLTPTDAETSITVHCLQDAVVSIDLDKGQNFASPRRRMVGSNANFLEYQLYMDSSRTNIWGATAGGAAVTGLQGQGAVLPTRDPNASAAPVVYGRIFEGGNNQSAPVDNTYRDTVTITVSF